MSDEILLPPSHVDKPSRELEMWLKSAGQTWKFAFDRGIVVKTPDGLQAAPWGNRLYKVGPELVRISKH